MIFSCNLEKLKKIINILNRISLKKDQNETLSSIFFIVEEKKIKIVSTNISLGTEFSIITKTNEQGFFSIPSQNIQQIISSIQIDKNEKDITFEIKEKTANIVYKKNKINLKINRSIETPILPFIKEQSFFIDKKTFIKGIETVLYSASKTDIKPELASIFINQNNGNLVFVTTDTFRLTEYKIQTNKEYSFPSILLPAKNAQEIIKIFEESLSESVEVYPTKNQISFVCEDVFITSQLINGVFPEYTKIIPTLKHATIQFLKTDMINILKTISNFTDIRNQIKVIFDSEKNEVIFFSENDSMGQYTGSIDAKIIGDTFEILLNKNYLEEAVFQLPENIEILINQPNKPLIIHSKQDPEVLSLLMPMSK